MIAYADPRLVRAPMNPLLKQGAAGTATSTKPEPAAPQPCRFSGCQPANLG